MTITLKELGPRKWHIDVAGQLPNGKSFRKRTTQSHLSRTDAHKYGENIWKEALSGGLGKTPTVQKYAEKWLAAREKRGLSSAKANRYQMAHLLPLLGALELAELRRQHIVEAIAHMRQNGRRAKGGGPIAPRTILHSYSLLSTMLNDAVADGHIAASPATLRARRKELPVKRDKDPTWRKSAIYTADELRTLTHDDRISWPQRVAYALEGLAGLRFGEASALRWRSWTADKAPLGELAIVEAWDSNNDRLKEVKTGVERWVPVHPRLAGVLTEWRRTGWRKTYGREPRPGDLVIPVLERKQLRCRTWHEGRAPHKAALLAVGMRHRRQHDLRRTFVTACRTGRGQNKDLLVWITHGVPTSIIDQYTTPPWEDLCELVALARLF